MIESCSLSLWEWGLQRAPISATPNTNLSLVYTNQGNPDLGLVLADQALQRDPKEANAYNNLGLALFQLGRLQEAESIFRQAIDLEPENPMYWNNLAGALREQDRLAEAEQILLDEALRLDPLLGMVHFNLGLVYLKANRPDLAASALSSALELMPGESAREVGYFLEQTRDPGRWLALGDLLLAKGEVDGALVAFAQADVFGAEPLDLVVGRSAAWITSGDLDQAETALEAALLGAPEDPRLYNNLGLIAQRRGDDEAGRGYFEKAAELAPEWDVPLQNLESLGP
jgi:superkiller protein 3